MVRAMGKATDADPRTPAPSTPSPGAATARDEAPAAAPSGASASTGKPGKPVDLADRLNDPDFRARLEEGLRNMPPEKAAELVEMLESALRRRRVELIGYIAAAVVMLVGMVLSLYAYGVSDHRSFMAWIFLLPMGLAGLIMWLVGRWARDDRARRKAARPRRPGV